MMKKSEIVKGIEKFGLKAEWQNINKNGVYHTGIVIMAQGGQVAPIIYTDRLINDWDSVDTAVQKILGEYRKAEHVSIDAVRITSRKFILEHITIAVQKNGVEKIVKRESGFDGIEAYLIVVISDEGDGSMSMKVTADLLTKSHISEAEAWETAEKNLHESIKIRSMSEVMADIMGEEFLELCGVDDSMYVISTKSNVKGAAAVLDKVTMQKFAEEHHTRRIAVLPSSIHEMLLIPNTDGLDEKNLSDMVEDVNTKEVIPEERLTDRAYFLDFE